MKFGRLTFLNEAGHSQTGKALWNFVCDCGQTKTIRADTVKDGGTRSCGCLAREYNTNQHNGRTHGMRDTVEYTTWRGMLYRCRSEKGDPHGAYFRRGI